MNLDKSRYVKVPANKKKRKKSKKRETPKKTGRKNVGSKTT
jgi:hypothetical protein